MHEIFFARFCRRGKEELDRLRLQLIVIGGSRKTLANERKGRKGKERGLMLKMKGRRKAGA